jgi:predicted secreted acid phosphatase
MSLRRWPRLTVATAVVAVAGVAVAVAMAANPSTDRSFTPQKADQVTNVDVLRQQIANYYGDPGKSGTFAADSNYAKEASSVAAQGSHWLSARSKVENKAIVLDVDDTTLATWNYEIFSNWAFNPATNGQFVIDQKFPAVPGMVDMVTQAANEGYAIFFLTGRPSSQAAATLGNLDNDGIGEDAGYPDPEALFTKPDVADYPPYLQAACAGDPGGKCTTIHYKAATRAHIENDLGYEIVANFGDQFSDLIGGFADKTFKLPNPNYFLP